MDIGIGGRLRALREAGGLDPLALSRAAGVSCSLVGMLERGERGTRISARAALDLARALGCSVEYLVDGTEAAPGPTTARAVLGRVDSDPSAHETTAAND